MCDNWRDLRRMQIPPSNKSHNNKKIVDKISWRFIAINIANPKTIVEGRVNFPH